MYIVTMFKMADKFTSDIKFKYISTLTTQSVHKNFHSSK